MQSTIARNQAAMANVQRLEDTPTNPLSGTPWRQSHRALLQSRRRLPVYEQFEGILNTYHQNQVMILSSEIGSGKSTQVPQLLMYDEHASGLKIACTQPRRLATITVARRVAAEMGVNLGKEVGYQIGGDSQYDPKRTRLVFMTEGVLLAKRMSDESLSEFACVVIDEVHERTVNTDMLLALLKKTIRRRKDFKVVIMSATMNAKLFQDYFKSCPLVHISGRSFDVEILYVDHEDTTSDICVLATSIVAHIHHNKGPGNILVFLPGVGEINNVCHLIRKYANIDVFPLYSTLSGSAQDQTLNSAGPNRKCIVSTNIAETSMTISGVVYVVDTGLSRQMIYNPRLGMNTLQMLPISQASAKQRAGRAGRTQNGVCYRLYSKESFDSMAASTEPAVRCAALQSATMKLIASGYKKVFDFDWIDPPHPESIGFVNDVGTPTRSGLKAAFFSLDPVWFHAIEEGAKLGCSMDILDIAVLCSSMKSIFLRPAHSRIVADLHHRAHASGMSDHISLANAFNLYLRVRNIHHDENGPKFDLDHWCAVHFLDKSALEEVRKKRSSLGPFLKSVAKLDPTRTSPTDTANIRKALAIAFCTQTAIRSAVGVTDEYQTVPNGVEARPPANSSLVNGNSEWIV